MSPEKVVKDSTNPAVNAVRKRRRRTGTTGASEDCFSCRNRQTKCDRRRPYCSQCLDMGKECSGYRTQLTWGVGVASRGKLRGLSLPVINSGKTTPSVQETKTLSPVSSTASPSFMPTLIPSHSPPINGTHPQEVRHVSPDPVFPRNYSPSPAYDHRGYCPAGVPVPIPIPSTEDLHWHSPTFNDQAHSYNISPRSCKPQFHPHTLQRLQTAFSSPYDDGSLSAPSTDSMGGLSDCSDFPSPSEYPRTPEELPLTDTLIDGYSDHFPQQAYAPQQNQMALPEGVAYLTIPRSFPLMADNMTSTRFAASFQHY